MRRPVLVIREDAEDVHVPADEPQAAVVLAHAINGHKEDLTQFAHALASHDVRVHNVEWDARTFASGRRDLTAAVERTRDHAAAVVLVTWSDAGFVGASVALDGRPDAFVGLAGYYGWPGDTPPPEVVNGRTIAFFATDPETDPAPWRAANPFCRMSTCMTPSRLVVGEHDPLRPAAEATGLPMTVVAGCGHAELVIPRLPSGRRAIECVLAAIHGGAR
jgi:hypothetical protein